MALTDAVVDALPRAGLLELIASSRRSCSIWRRTWTGLLHREGRELFLNRDRLAEYLGPARIP